MYSVLQSSESQFCLTWCYINVLCTILKFHGSFLKNLCLTQFNKTRFVEMGPVAGTHTLVILEFIHSVMHTASAVYLQAAHCNQHCTPGCRIKLCLASYVHQQWKWDLSLFKLPWSPSWPTCSFKEKKVSGSNGMTRLCLFWYSLENIWRQEWWRSISSFYDVLQLFGVLYWP